MSERKSMDITHFQSECVVGYSRFANISITESSKLFTQYNLFSFINKCYDILHLDDIEYVIENDIADRIANGIYYQPTIWEKWWLDNNCFTFLISKIIFGGVYGY